MIEIPSPSAIFVIILPPIKLQISICVLRWFATDASQGKIHRYEKAQKGMGFDSRYTNKKSKRSSIVAEDILKYIFNDEIFAKEG